MAPETGQLCTKVPKLVALMDSAEEDVPACMRFPAAHRTKLHSTDLYRPRFLGHPAEG